MKQSWMTRLTWWYCDHFGHDLWGTPLLDGSRWCKRCGRAAKG